MAPAALNPEPRWPALIAVLAVGGLYLALHADLVSGPRWLLPANVGTLLVGVVHLLGVRRRDAEDELLERHVFDTFKLGVPAQRCPASGAVTKPCDEIGTPSPPFGVPMSFAWRM